LSIDYNQEMSVINAGLQNQRTLLERWDAHYYPFLDGEGRLLASLTVLLDSELRALRAELIFRENPPVAAQSAVTRQAKNLVMCSYAGSGDTTEITILESRGQGAIPIEHSGQPIFKKERGYRLWPIAAAIAIVFVVVLIVLLMSVFGRAPQTAATSPTPSPTVTVPPTPAVAGAPPGSTEQQSSDGQTYYAQTNDLAASVNADGDLAPGDRVRIRRGLAAYLRSEPGPAAGQELVIMENQQMGRIIGGPVWLKGDTDTIVWWYVELDESGVKGWVSANTSQIRVLEQVR
jgi:hypothetical protein